ncbi:unnamed protein product [Adineta steineri]|uniref:Uncharacterized protein n=1 Tax=Adineta steineri TaxID=433720 RepID=A0A813WAA3_9BILA|nr:unnamed protein product [Adineta steineri]CAF0848449.1 unnamed protein product [Adineta steineri]
MLNFYLEFAAPGTYESLKCGGRQCAKCGKCRDSYYTGDMETWRWIINVMKWDEKEQKRWDDGKYSERFKRRNGSTCRGRFGYDIYRNDDQYRGHINIDSYEEYHESYYSLHGRFRSFSKVDRAPYCQCSDNSKQS